MAMYRWFRVLRVCFFAFDLFLFFISCYGRLVSVEFVASIVSIFFLHFGALEKF